MEAPHYQRLSLSLSISLILVEPRLFLCVFVCVCVSLCVRPCVCASCLWVVIEPCSFVSRPRVCAPCAPCALSAVGSVELGSFMRPSLCVLLRI